MREHAGRAEVRGGQVPAVVDDRLDPHPERQRVAAVLERDAQVRAPEPERDHGDEHRGHRGAAIRQQAAGTGRGGCGSRPRLLSARVAVALVLGPHRSAPWTLEARPGQRVGQSQVAPGTSKRRLGFSAC